MPRCPNPNRSTAVKDAPLGGMCQLRTFLLIRCVQGGPCVQRSILLKPGTPHEGGNCVCVNSLEQNERDQSSADDKGGLDKQEDLSDELSVHPQKFCPQNTYLRIG